MLLQDAIVFWITSVAFGTTIVVNLFVTTGFLSSILKRYDSYLAKKLNWPTKNNNHLHWTYHFLSYGVEPPEKEIKGSAFIKLYIYKALKKSLRKNNVNMSVKDFTKFYLAANDTPTYASAKTLSHLEVYSLMSEGMDSEKILTFLNKGFTYHQILSVKDLPVEWGARILKDA